MTHKNDSFLGQTPLHTETYPVGGSYVELLGERFYRISNYDQMPSFFMSLVSSSDHWLFIASSGGLTAGRTNADSALFPYETEDKITAHHELTGSKTVIRVRQNGRFSLWHPLSNQYAGLYRCQRHLYKNIPGNKLIFEEINHDLRLTFRRAWRTSDRFGFIKTSWLQNDGDACHIELLDGLQNILPYGATSALQATFSNLLHAYKRSELHPETGLGIFALSATLTDQAEPSESLQATAVWQVGLDNPTHLLCTDQVAAFINGRLPTPESDICGKPGAYLVHTSRQLAAAQTLHWHIGADINQDSAALSQLLGWLRQDRATLMAQIEADIDQGTTKLQAIVAAADGLQQSAQATTSAHHFANILFNVMRGGIFANGYEVERGDFLAFVQERNRVVAAQQADWLAALPPHFAISQLYQRAAASNNPDLIRLSYEYLPLTFSRRHGDPSRPWNQFSINLKQPDGSPRLDYQGNWRDIFQNWEPMAFAFPDYAGGFIAKFLNATSADGYNPYRVTRSGIEWEVPEPDNPWANIGYWSDHQIIYLQKLLEAAEQVQPGLLPQLWQQPIFAYANVPYRLKSYQEMLADWYNTITFDWDSEAATATAVSQLGTDGRLHHQPDGTVHHVTMVEKLLVLLLAKLTNFVPDGGIWMNTQRPEWNDANNALVGKGLSIVTTAYLRRFITFWRQQLAQAAANEFVINRAVADLLNQVQTIFAAHQPHLHSSFDDHSRRAMMDALGAAATAYRSDLYANGLPAAQTSLNSQALADFLALAQQYLDQTLRSNKRPDNLYHTYNILRLDDDQSAAVDHLYLMLEGQVALLAAGLLTAEEAVTLLHSLRHSDLYRPDQHSYMLYPNRKLAGFLQKNNVPADLVAESALVAALTVADNRQLLMRDQAGVYHFNGRFRNAGDVVHALNSLAQDPALAPLVAAERDDMMALFEQTFNHRAFTGRSGTFFAFEGLGSIYWHMVSKLLLAVQECYQQAVAAGAETAVCTTLAEAYYDVRQGLSFNKTPLVYGAFPTDPYSHTPMGSGARQPGMTGQVKEEILTRWGELGVSVTAGQLHFAPTLLRDDEFLPEPQSFTYFDVAGQPQTLPLPAGSLAFTYCQTPIIYQRGEQATIVVEGANGRSIVGATLDAATTRHIFARDGAVTLLRVTLA